MKTMSIPVSSVCPVVLEHRQIPFHPYPDSVRQALPYTHLTCEETDFAQDHPGGDRARIGGQCAIIVPTAIVNYQTKLQDSALRGGTWLRSPTCPPGEGQRRSQKSSQPRINSTIPQTEFPMPSQFFLLLPVTKEFWKSDTKRERVYLLGFSWFKAWRLEVRNRKA